MTRDSVAAELGALGVRAGETLLVHSSLRALGWVCGGTVAVVQGLIDAIGPQGTLVVPTQSGHLSTRPCGPTRRCPGSGGRRSGPRCPRTTP
ncbi:hypothetical protein GCM10010254_35820 [Streptomyces chromofuscus]|nr:hypothetical protein GCM10010254_35820 [Streptomyces chromofuscus]